MISINYCFRELDLILQVVKIVLSYCNVTPHTTVAIWSLPCFWSLFCQDMDLKFVMPDWLITLGCMFHDYYSLIVYRFQWHSSEDCKGKQDSFEIKIAKTNLRIDLVPGRVAAVPFLVRSMSEPSQNHTHAHKILKHRLQRCDILEQASERLKMM